MHDHCVLAALANGANPLIDAQLQHRFEAVASLVTTGLCPRCAGRLPKYPDTSHAIPDRCLPLCAECAITEALAQARTGTVPPLTTWPALSPPTAPNPAIRIAFYGSCPGTEHAMHLLRQQYDLVADAIHRKAAITRCFANNQLDNTPQAVLPIGPHTITGGLTHLIDQSTNPDRDFDAIACADITYLSSNTLHRLKIETELATNGIPVVTALGSAVFAHTLYTRPSHGTDRN
ncbi:hypothetical protein [Actinokineospora pegani]|uniref:hypothetical protein n=1 Tax=Actinokineospora pegani TaxID=2654637 RepID=UPI0012EA5FB0|nr:hypothetical protein [Actinokineospora pegani]